MHQVLSFRNSLSNVSKLTRIAILCIALCTFIAVRAVLGAEWIVNVSGGDAVMFHLRNIYLDGKSYLRLYKSLLDLGAKDAYTFGIMFKPVAFATGQFQTLIAVAFGVHDIRLRATSNAIEYLVKHGTTVSRVALVYIPATPAWYYAVLSAKSYTGAWAYLNGELKGSITFTDKLSDTFNEIYIGVELPGERLFKGYIALVQIFNRTVTGTEVSTFYNNYTITNVTGLVVLLDPTYSDGLKLFDLSGHGNNAYFVGDVKIVEAENKFVIVLKHFYGDNLAHIWVPPYTCIVISNNALRRVVCNLKPVYPYLDYRVPPGVYSLAVIYPVHAGVVRGEFRLPISVMNVRFNITYSPYATQLNHTIIYTINATSTSLVTASPHDWAWRFYVTPYQNRTVAPVDKNATLLGTWISGTVSDLASYDNVWMKFQSYNATNIMKILLTFNVTANSWLPKIASDNTLQIKDIIVYVAGNVSKYVNTRASLEILNWTSGQWVTIDAVAFNQTTDTEKSYSLATVLGGNLKDLISPTGVIAFRINITDVQTYPSTYVYFTIDELKVEVVYVNETDAVLVSEITIPFLPNSTVYVSKVVFDARTLGTGFYRKLTVDVINASGVTIVHIDNASMGTSWVRNVVPIGRTVHGNITLRFTLHVTSSLTANEEIDIANVRVYTNGTANMTVLFYCVAPTFNIYEFGGRLPVYCTLLVPVVRGLAYANYTVLNMSVPWYFTVYGTAHDSMPTPNTVKRVGESRLVTITNALGNTNISALMIENVTDITSLGFGTIRLYMPVGTISLLSIIAPTPYMFIMFDNGTTIQYSSTHVTITVKHSGELRWLNTYYGLYINNTLYAWVNLTNPTIKIETMTFNKNKLTATIDLTGIGELNVYTLKLPTAVTVDNVHAVAVPDYASYRACTPPCYWYDPVTHILHVKIRGHSPVTIVVDWTKPTQGTNHPEVRSVGLTFNSTNVPVNRPVQYTVNVELYNAWSGVLTYTLTCTGPRTVSITGKITVTDGKGTVIGYVTFSKAGTYACYVKVLDTYSPTIYVNVISHKAPFMAHTFTAYALLLLLVVAIVVIVIFIVEKKRRSGSGGEIVVRLNI